MNKNTKIKKIVLTIVIFLITIAATVVAGSYYSSKQFQQAEKNIEEMLNKREQVDNPSNSVDFDQYFTANFKNLEKQSNKKTPTIQHSLKASGFINISVALEIKGIDKNGSVVDLPIVVFNTKKEQGKYKVDSLTQVDPSFNQNLGNILPVINAKEIKIGEKIRIERQELAIEKLEKIKSSLITIQQPTSQPRSSADLPQPTNNDINKTTEYQLTLNGNIGSTKMFFWLGDEKGKPCSIISDKIFDNKIRLPYDNNCKIIFFSTPKGDQFKLPFSANDIIKQ